MQVEFRRTWLGMLQEQVHVDLMLFLRTAARDIVHEDFFASTEFMSL